MGTITSILTLALLVALIVGLVKPELILRNSEKPSRLKIVGFWFVGMLIVTALGNWFQSDEERAANKIKDAKEYMQKEDYQSVVDELKDINEDNPHYSEAQALFQKADSINNITPEERIAASKLDEEVKLKENIKLNLDIIDEFDYSKLRGTVHVLEGELSQFAIWGDLVVKGESSEDDEIKKLAGQLGTKLTRVQVREFPSMRKEYARIAAKKLWEEDIEVTSSGTGNNQITFIGGVFAANRNKKKFQEDINSIMLEFRFNRVNYKWHKGEQEYSYYTVYEGKDSDIFTFEK